MRCRWRLEADATLEVVHVIEDAAVDEVQTTQHFRVPEDPAGTAPSSPWRRCGSTSPMPHGRPARFRSASCSAAQATAILREAREIGAEVIVMGAGDHAHVRSLWLGHATSQIARESLCPILVVPAPKPLRRTRMLKVKPIARENWRAEFDRISRECLREPATVTALDLAYAAPEVTALPLVGITMDLAPDSDIVMILAGPGRPHQSSDRRPDRSRARPESDACDHQVAGA